MSRAERRRVARFMDRRMRRGHVEGGTVTAACGWRSCGLGMPPAADMQGASELLRSHYELAHDGVEPSPDNDWAPQPWQVRKSRLGGPA